MAHTDRRTLERELATVRLSLTSVERMEASLSSALSTANLAQTRAEQALERAKAEHDKAEKEVHAINAKQALNAKEKAELAQRLTELNAQKRDLEEAERQEKEKGKA